MADKTSFAGVAAKYLSNLVYTFRTAVEKVFSAYELRRPLFCCGYPCDALLRPRNWATIDVSYMKQ